MDSRYKLVTSYFDDFQQKSIVKIATPLGVFSGSAKLRMGDKKSYIGYEIAEIKAVRKYYRAKKAKFKQRASALVDAYCLQTKTQQELDLEFDSEQDSLIAYNIYEKPLLNLALGYFAEITKINKDLKELDDLVKEKLDQYAKGQESLKRFVDKKTEK